METCSLKYKHIFPPNKINQCYQTIGYDLNNFMISSCPNMVLYHSPQKKQTIKFKLWVDWIGSGSLRGVGAQSMQLV